MVLPGLPEPDAQVGGGVVHKERRVGHLGASADIPPEVLACGLAFGDGGEDGAVGDWAPEVRSADEGGFDLFGEEAPKVRGALAELAEAIHHVGIIVLFGFVVPIDIAHVEPAFFAQVLLNLMEVVSVEGGEFGSALQEAAEARELLAVDFHGGV